MRAAAVIGSPPPPRTPWSIQVVETAGDRISAIHNFLVPELFAMFGFPPALVEEINR